MRVAVSSPLFHFLPNVKEELLAEYPDAKIKENAKILSGDALIEFCEDYEAIAISLDRFDEYVVSRLPELKVVSCCSAGTDHLDPAAEPSNDREPSLDALGGSSDGEAL